MSGFLGRGRNLILCIQTDGGVCESAGAEASGGEAAVDDGVGCGGAVAAAVDGVRLETVAAAEVRGKNG